MATTIMERKVRTTVPRMATGLPRVLKIGNFTWAATRTTRAVL